MQDEPWTPLAEAIAPHIDKPFAELPDELRQRIKRESAWLAQWDGADPELRRLRAQQSDDDSNPARQTENEAALFTGFWEAPKHDGKGRVKFWLDRKAVTADEAARLLCDDDPIENPQDRAPASLDAAFNLLHRAFCEAAQDGRARSLRDWVALAQAAGLGHLASVEPWAACCTVFAGESRPAAPENAPVRDSMPLPCDPLPRWMTLEKAAAALRERTGRPWASEQILECAAQRRITVWGRIDRSARFVRLMPVEGQSNETNAEAGCWLRLASQALDALLLAGEADVLGWERPGKMDVFAGEPIDVWRTEFELAPGEAAPVVRMADCRVSADGLNQLADAFAPDEKATGTQAAPERTSDEAQEVPADDERPIEGRTAKRRDLLAPLIGAAQRECNNSSDAVVVWPVLVGYAKSARRPLIGVCEDGIQWENGSDETRYFTMKNLRDRLSRMAKTDLPRRGKTR